MQAKIVSLHKRWTRMLFILYQQKLKTPILTHYLNITNVLQINNTVGGNTFTPKVMNDLTAQIGLIYMVKGSRIR